MKRLILLLLIPTFACSETEGDPEAMVPTISIHLDTSWIGTYTPIEHRDRTGFFVRSASFYLESDIPMPADTYILVNAELVRIRKGKSRSEVNYRGTVCDKSNPPEETQFEIRPMDERSYWYNPPPGRYFRPYKIGEPSAILVDDWCIRLYDKPAYYDEYYFPEPP